jgi:hypothetical protein
LNQEKGASSSNVGAIVGPIIAVLVIAALAVSIFILYRRNKLQNVKTCFKLGSGKRQPPASHNMHALDNAAYNPHVIAQQDSVIDDVTGGAAAASRDYFNIGHTSSPPQSPDYYNVTHRPATAQTPQDQYAAVNKPRKVQTSPSKPADHGAQPQQAAGRNGQSYYELAHVPNTNVYHTLESQGDGEYSLARVPGVGPGPHASSDDYHALDFDGHRAGVPESTGDVYNHLQADSQDDYSHVDRDGKVKVIDDEYSHTHQH